MGSFLTREIGTEEREDLRSNPRQELRELRTEICFMVKFRIRCKSHRFYQYKPLSGYRMAPDFSHAQISAYI